MELDHHEVLELAEFFSRRFPSPHQRETLARAARLRWIEGVEDDPRQAWLGLLSRAVGRPELRRLIRAASMDSPDDENLQEIYRLMVRPRWRSPRFAVGVMAGAVALGLLVALPLRAWLSDDAADDGLLDAPVTAAPASVELTAAVEEPVLAPAAPRPWVEGNPLDQPQGSAEPPEPSAAVVTPAQKSEHDPAFDHGRCTTSDDGLVGYWYAGRDAPGAEGETITMDETVYVRADYPDTHNSYDKRTAIRCSLKLGDRVHLTKAPVKVPGDAYWVPLVSGDLRTP